MSSETTTEKVLRGQRDIVAFFIATGGDDYAKADAIIDHLVEIVNKVKL